MVSPGVAPDGDGTATQSQTVGQSVQRARACDSCRGLKVRCISNNSHGPCLRCRKATRVCVTTVPPAGSRKVRKKTVSRVTELEKKIDLLTASLRAGRAEAAADSLDNSSAGGGGESNTPPTGGAAGMPAGDIVDRGIISSQKADALLSRYNTQLVPHMPAVIFPPDLTATELRETRPTLFLAVATAASTDTPELQRLLSHELTRVFAEKIMIRAEKSLELVQALQITVTWYWLPDEYDQVHIYHLTTTCISMAIDIGLGGYPTALDARRTWLVCYFMASNTAYAMKRPLLLRWTRAMTESLEVLRSSPERYETDEYLCAVVWASRLAEDIDQCCGLPDDPDEIFKAPQTLYYLRKLEQDLCTFRDSLPKGMAQGSLRMVFSAIPLTVYNNVLRIQPPEERQHKANVAAIPSRTPRSVVMADSAFMTMANTDAISSCLSHVDIVLGAFLSLSPEAVRCLPTFGIMRAVRAASMLVRLHLTLVDDPQLLSPFRREDLRAGFCIDELQRHFRAAAEGNRCRTAAKFIVVLAMLKDCMGSNRGGHGPPARSEQAQEQLSLETPLHLLSHAAAAATATGSAQQGSGIGGNAERLTFPDPNGQPSSVAPSVWQDFSGGAQALSLPGPLAFGTDQFMALYDQDLAFSLGLDYMYSGNSMPLYAGEASTGHLFVARTGNSVYVKSSLRLNIRFGDFQDGRVV
ncbi:Transcriptional regulator WAR1 like protein [Verticillium longisporum]|nr:Transcriptional regulator WAR1 like protein [Verticillium longisporum]